jgi:heat shock protein HslJ
MRRAPRALLPILAAASLLVGAPAVAQTPEPVQVLDVEWTLSRLDGESVPPDPAVTATFASDGALTGSGGCNGYSATWTSDGSSLTVTDLQATRMACSDEVDAQEASYFRLLEDAASWSLDGTAIVITTTSGATLMYGGDGATTDGLTLVGSWPLATVDGEAPPPGMSVTLDIRADGTLSGEACNAYNASYTATEAGDLSVDAIAATRKSCGDAADAFEASYLDGLQNATQWGTQDGQLFLFGSADLVFGAGSASDATLTGQEWLLTAIGGAPIDGGLGISVSFGEDGTATGSGGCNRFTGPYTADDETLSVGPLASTRMSCGVTTDDLESTYLSALESAVGFAISGQDLVISTTTDQTLEFSTSAGPVEPTATPAATPAATAVPVATAATTTGDIVGTWRMTTYVNQSLPANMLAIDITFADDGTFTGFGGCNDYMGQWALDGTRLVVSNFESASSGTCDQLTQGLETGYFSLLPFLDTAEVGADGSLSLVSALGGNQGFVFERAD